LLSQPVPDVEEDSLDPRGLVSESPHFDSVRTSDHNVLEQEVSSGVRCGSTPAARAGVQKVYASVIYRRALRPNHDSLDRRASKTLCANSARGSGENRRGE
jgi:hypothetical protein